MSFTAHDNLFRYKYWARNFYLEQVHESLEGDVLTGHQQSGGLARLANWVGSQNKIVLLRILM